MKLLNFHINPGGSLQGIAAIPADKSISHRAVMLAAIAEGDTSIHNFLESADCIATLNAFSQMGVRYQRKSHGHLTIHGVGLHGLKAPKASIDLGNSGTSMRLLCGLLAGQKFSSVVSGDASLQKRPMGRVIEPLRKMGAMIESAANGLPPLTIHGGQSLHGINYEMPLASAQVKSCILLAGLYAKSKTCVYEPHPSRDHTERMLKSFGVEIESHKGHICLQTPACLQATTLHIPSDLSSAAFFMVGASIAAHSEVILKNIGINSTRDGVIKLLQRMQANIKLENKRMVGGEPVADIHIKSAKLQGINIDKEDVALAIDELPILFIAAAFAQGKTSIRGAGELRVKESDRLQAMISGLKILGVEVEEYPDGALIHGNNGSYFQGGEIESLGDHRIAMAFAMAGLVAEKPVFIRDCINVNTSFPDFVQQAKGLGLAIKAVEEAIKEHK